MNKNKGIDFEKLFLKGHKSYDTAIGDWWETQASNGSHRKAYQLIVNYVEESLRKQKVKSPKWVVDYACGSGPFLQALALRFPEANIVALDGSLKMLERARARLEKSKIDADLVSTKNCFEKKGPRVRLVKSSLPNFSLPKHKADVVIFVFPNLTPSPDDQDYYDKHGYLNRADTKLCTVLSRLREMDPEDEVNVVKPKDLYESLMTDRVISRNLRHLLKPKGICFKVDYANAHRSELSELTQNRSLFTEGALELPIKTLQSERFFKYRDNRFHRSQVILDVYHQTRDKSDKTGGFFITKLDAV